MNNNFNHMEVDVDYVLGTNRQGFFYECIH